MRSIFLRDNHFTGLQIGDHPEDLGTVGVGTRCLLAVDTSDVITRRSRALLDFGLSGEVLFVSADAKIDAGDFHWRQPGWVHRTWPSLDGAAKNAKASVRWLRQNWPPILAVTGPPARAADRQIERSSRTAVAAHPRFPVGWCWRNLQEANRGANSFCYVVQLRTVLVVTPGSRPCQGRPLLHHAVGHDQTEDAAVDMLNRLQGKRGDENSHAGPCRVRCCEATFESCLVIHKHRTLTRVLA